MVVRLSVIEQAKRFTTRTGYHPTLIGGDCGTSKTAMLRMATKKKRSDSNKTRIHSII
tara:strand:+ start:180 stop:353 length:174 start_codon:yes stop_codon:yes gene_type:complete